MMASPDAATALVDRVDGRAKQAQVILPTALANLVARLAALIHVLSLG